MEILSHLADRIQGEYFTAVKHITQDIQIEADLEIFSSHLHKTRSID